ncbi:MAG TPA: cytochrome c [Verrucomicrobiae bacterium]|nr:cytochrome c [Verrucomicrobiae bacterium]
MNSADKAGIIRVEKFVFRKVVVLGLFAAGILACVGGAIRSAGAADAPKTTMDGVYTDDQAARGKALYGQNCASCHMDDLSGSGQALPLAGDAFTDTWEGQSVGDLFDLIHNTMPQDKPGTLGADTVVDLISYLLQYNKYPAGKDELKSDPDGMKKITITKKANAPSAQPKQ